MRKPLVRLSSVHKSHSLYLVEGKATIPTQAALLMKTWLPAAWDDGTLFPKLLLTESLLAGPELSGSPAQSG